jgi:hypothetical protein
MLRQEMREVRRAERVAIAIAFGLTTDLSQTQEAAWRNDALKWIEANLAPIFDKAQIDYKIDIVAYDTNSSSVGEILCEKATLLDDAVAVCVASTSKGRLKEFFIGSVCNYCLHRCKKPVIVFKPSDEENEENETAAA